MKKITLYSFTLLLLVLSGHPVFAAVQDWQLDKAHTNFYFRIGHIFSKIGGHFNDFSGELRFDPENLSDSRFFFEIQTDSVDTGIAKRDKHLQSSDFFDTGKYPVMTFESTKITDMGKNIFQVLGTFTVKGVPYQLALPFTFEGIKDHPAAKGKEVIGLNGEVTIDRLAYKVGTGKFYEMGVVDKDVEILVSIEALKDK